MSSWQVFGLTGYLLAPASQPLFRLCACLIATSALRSERSFLHTAAGQFRPHTGFPFHQISSIQHREVK
jgi:hypothetical protein